MSSKKQLKISFLWDWEPDYAQATTWQDGLAAALKELQNRGHEIKLFTTAKQPTIIKHPYFDIVVSDNVPRDIADHDPDVILHWGDMTRPHAVKLLGLQKPMAICFAGGEALGENVELFQHIFVESQVYEDVYREKGYSVSRAFGTNTELFKPVEQPKLFDTLFPATFAAWKRHELFAHASVGLNALAVGYMYTEHETECWQVCLDNGVVVLPHVAHHVLPRLYAASKVVVIPSRSDGGSQRTVLEAMAMNIPVIVCDSDKFDFAGGRVFQAEPTIKDLGNMIRATLDSEVSTRDYIVKNWSEFNYADALEEGLLKIV